jgi:hypothetical protein
MPDYDIIDRDSRTVAEIPSVLAPVTLTSVQTSSNSNEVTVASTTGCFPGMAVAIPGVPLGAFIHAVKSSTVLELWRSVWDSSTGAWTTSAASANATASASSLTGHAFGYHPFCLIEQTYAMGMWRNIHSSNSANGGVSSTGVTEYVAHESYGAGVAIVPTTGTISGGLYTMTAGEVRVADTLASTPVKRSNGERWGVRPFVQTGGLVSHVPARPDWSVVCAAVA